MSEITPEPPSDNAYNEEAGMNYVLPKETPQKPETDTSQDNYVSEIKNDSQKEVLKTSSKADNGDALSLHDKKSNKSTIFSIVGWFCGKKYQDQQSLNSGDDDENKPIPKR